MFSRVVTSSSGVMYEYPPVKVVDVKPLYKQSIALPMIQKDLAHCLPTVLCGQGGREVA